MKILYGTTNPAKLQHMREILEGISLEVLGFNDVNIHMEPVDESGNDPLENAKIKAKAYYRACQMPVFSCDTGLYIEGVDDSIQPGVYVRRVNGKTLSDEEMIAYYAAIASRMGGTARAAYRNAICFVLNERQVYAYDGSDISSVPFLLSSKIHRARNLGFPLDSISVDIRTGQYFVEMDMIGTDSDEGENTMATGYRRFFLQALSQMHVSS